MIEVELQLTDAQGAAILGYKIFPEALQIGHTILFEGSSSKHAAVKQWTLRVVGVTWVALATSPSCYLTVEEVCP